MINKILRWLFGYVIFTAKGKFPERLINLALLHDITLIKPKAENGNITAQTSVHNYRELCDIRKNADVTMKVQKKIGLPFVLHRNRKRKGLLVGIIFFLGVIYTFSQFIWTVDIHGNHSMSICEIQNTMRQCGIYSGAVKKNINIPHCERNFELLTGKIGWISINLIGCKAEIEISESYQKPEITHSNIPANIKAKKSGQILKMNINQGKNMVAVGDGVAKGQLLVSGIFRNEITQTTEILHSDGEVFADVSERCTVEINRKIFVNTFSELPKRRVIRLLRCKFPLNYKAVDNVSCRNYVLDKFTLNNTTLPFELITEENFSVNTRQISLTPDIAGQIADIQLALYEVFSCWNYDIKNKSVQYSHDNNRYLFTGNYQCIEDIADCVEIQMNNKE